MNMLLCAIPFLCTESLTASSTEHLLEKKLTVENMLRPYSDERIENEYITRNIEFKPEYLSAIRTLISSILRSDPATRQLVQVDPKTEDDNPQKNNLFIPLLNLSYEPLLKAVHGLFKSVKDRLATQKKKEEDEDKEIAKSPTFRIAHHLALQTVLNLIFIIYSPYAHPSERMRALFELNKMNLLGTRGAALRQMRAYLNAYFFEKNGSLVCYDPSRDAQNEPKKRDLLTCLIKLVSRGKLQYLGYLKQAIEWGITALSPLYEKERQSSSSKMISYFAGLTFIKDLATVDLKRRVDARTVTENNLNKCFMRVMDLCSVDTSTPEQWLGRFARAKKLIDNLQKAHGSHTCTSISILTRYYNEVHERVFSDLLMRTFDNDPLSKEFHFSTDKDKLMSRLLARKAGKTTIEKEFHIYQRSPTTSHLLFELGERWSHAHSAGNTFNEFLLEVLTFLTAYAQQFPNEAEAQRAYRTFFDQRGILIPLKRVSELPSISGNEKLSQFQRIYLINRELLGQKKQEYIAL
jgi:hypothetical protein